MPTMNLVELTRAVMFEAFLLGMAPAFACVFVLTFTCGVYTTHTVLDHSDRYSLGRYMRAICCCAPVSCNLLPI